MMLSGFIPPLKPYEPMHPNMVDEVVVQEHQRGVYYWPQLGSPPISLDDWAKAEKERYAEAHSKAVDD